MTEMEPEANGEKSQDSAGGETSRSVSAGEYLARFPHYDQAMEVDELTVEEATTQFFDFVEQHRPCVIRGAVEHWPALREWRSDRLREKVGSHVVGRTGPGVLYEPIVEFSLDRMIQTPNQMTFGDFLDEVEMHPNRRVQLYSEHLSDLGPLQDDIDNIEFLDRAALPSYFYANRFFVSQKGYTDWHLHFGDESLTTQITGDKEFLLLPPDNETFSTMFPMARRGVWKTPQASWPNDFSGLTPYRVVLRPGDALYIPMHWWHAVEALEGDLNVTFARVFGTPSRWLADLRLANVRFSLCQSLLMTLVGSVTSLRPRYVRQSARLMWMTLRDFRSARAQNTPNPKVSSYWGDTPVELL